MKQRCKGRPADSDLARTAAGQCQDLRLGGNARGNLARPPLPEGEAESRRCRDSGEGLRLFRRSLRSLLSRGRRLPPPPPPFGLLTKPARNSPPPLWGRAGRGAPGIRLPVLSPPAVHQPQ